MNKENKIHRGSCLCRAISIEVTGDLPPPNACHCSKCRKHSGHYGASTDLPKAAVKIKGLDQVTWFQSSAKVRRGFCSVCGSSLFWDPIFENWIAVAMGAFDGCTNAKLVKHIFVADRGDYYEIADGLPQDLTPPAPCDIHPTNQQLP